MQTTVRAARSARSLWLAAGVATSLIGTALSPGLAQTRPHRDWVHLGSGYSPVPAVRAAQYLLREQGFALNVDGSYGSQTREKVRRFQAKIGLDTTGVVDNQTWERLVIPVHRGSRGNAVRAVQSLLRAYSGPVGNWRYSVPLDGVFNAQTERAVRLFQTNSDLHVDGLVGPLTWCQLVSDASG